ncbi:DUF1217 domain-containing protein [Aestuariivirga litoralis]|uniref:DUF1217 domain-containing protein n=1 Tax=Aestuariivirga litoralis TaxID=2650924 RepID=UPI0018C5E559|nr:DUF1217 domain-containing protein [Aestuariivirga litoralis]MBG1233205.1 DUF1217 domain-containing protein [Aestuariivirga litoralis]
MSLISNYTMMTANTDRTLTNLAKQPQAARDIAYFQANIGTIKTVDDFVGNTRIFNFAMKAYGLDDMTYAKAFLKKALKDGVATSDTFAMKLSDPRFKAFVTAFNFAANGTATTSSETLKTTTVDKYKQALLEDSAGQQDPSLKIAMYFKDNINSVTSIYGIMGNKALYQMVQTTLGLPAAMSNIDIDQQAKFISAKFNLDDMKDPKKLDNFVKRYLAVYDMTNNTSAASNPAVSILSGDTTATGVSQSTLLSLQSYKRYSF